MECFLCSLDTYLGQNPHVAISNILLTSSTGTHISNSSTAARHMITPHESLQVIAGSQFSRAPVGNGVGGAGAGDIVGIRSGISGGQKPQKAKGLKPKTWSTRALGVQRFEPCPVANTKHIWIPSLPSSGVQGIKSVQRSKTVGVAVNPFWVGAIVDGSVVG
jgi:hypothetical protein